MERNRDDAREAAFEKMVDEWCSGCETCQFEGDGSCAPKKDGFADRLFNAGFDAAQGGWVPVETVEDWPDDDGEFIVAYRWDDQSGPFTKSAEFFANGEDEPAWLIDGVSGEPTIVAYMPKPKYEEKR